MTTLEKAKKGEQLTGKELEELGFEYKSSLIPEYSKNGVKFSYYGGELCELTIDEEPIENLFDIPEARGIDDELCYRITAEQLSFAYEKAGII
jgi:hypothetical protein